MLDWDRITKNKGFTSIELMIRYFYYEKNLSLRASGREIGVSWVSLKSKMRELKIPIRPRGGRNNFKDISISYREYLQFSMKELCKKYKVSTCCIYYRTCHYPRKKRKKAIQPPLALPPSSSG